MYKEQSMQLTSSLFLQPSLINDLSSLSLSNQEVNPFLPRHDLIISSSYQLFKWLFLIR